jgi:hypothetical protein
MKLDTSSYVKRRLKERALTKVITKLSTGLVVITSSVLYKVSKVKQSLYTPCRRLRGEEV